MSDWKALAEKELRGRSIEEIEWETLEGIRVKPLYTEADTEDFKVATSRMWDDYSQVRKYPRGALIMDPAGEKVGVYFSSIRFVSIDFKPENRVQLLLDTSVYRGGPDDRRSP